MSGYPPGTEVLRAVSRFLRDELLPVTPGREGFNLRVSINAVDLVVRELEQKGAIDEAELAGLGALLGPADASLADQRGALAERIRQNDPSLDPAMLRAHLRCTAISQLMIDQPRYSALTAALAAGEATEPTG
jgi:hypothetical protein